MKEQSSGRRARAARSHGIAWVLCLGAGIPASGQDSLSLDQALAAVGHHPALVALDMEARARGGLAAQAGAWPNPRLAVEAENFAGAGPAASGEALETTARLEQPVELGGKRALRRELADADRRLAEQDRDTRARELFRDVRALFTEGLWLQERQRLLRDDIAFLDEAADAVRRRAAAGGGAVAEERKFAVRRARARLDEAQLEGRLQSLRIRLAALMGRDEPGFAGLRGSLDRRAEPPAWDTVVAALERHPALRTARLEKDRQELTLRAARAQNIPDLDISAGVRRLHAQGTAGDGGGGWQLVGGVSVPLPVWNRSRGDIRGAELRGLAAGRAETAVRRDLRARAHTLWNGLNVRAAVLDRLRDDVLPDAAAARESSRAAYAAGRFDALEMMDGYRLWLDTRERYIALLLEHHRDAAALAALTKSPETLTAFNPETDR